MKALNVWTLIAACLVCQTLLYNIFCGNLSARQSFRPTMQPSGLANPGAGSSLRRGNVAIIGASGFVGSRLFDYLKENGAFKVVGYDRDPRDPERISLVTKLEAKDMTDDELNEYAVVVYLGGLTGRKVCEGNEARVQQENVHDVVMFASRMKKDQLLIFASTSAIGEGYGSKPMSESDEPYLTLMDAYTRSLWEREHALRRLHEQDTGPRMIGLRFGTVLGVSPSQRTEMVLMALVRSVFLAGKIDVMHGESYRGFAWLEDICRVMETVIERHLNTQTVQLIPPFGIYNIQSFHASVERIATEVAAVTGAPLWSHGHKPSQDVVGFSLMPDLFEATFDFEFKGNLRAVLEEMQASASHVATGRDWYFEPQKESIPCVVCGHKHMLTIFDLDKQPLANDFRKTAAEASRSRYQPLRLVRCPKCHHAQLADVYDRSELFEDYSYQSGTSRTLIEYFKWLADKIEKDAVGDWGKDERSVIEIASNDGSQLDQFKAIGWKTYGVDPAANLAKIAQKKGHKVTVGFWGSGEFDTLPDANSITAIVAQNVLAHVGDPIQFLKDCVKYMGPRTRLYTQTSQCEMFTTGQFDTVYHEHISFFTAHSFQRAGELSGLTIVNIQITPIHGNSCLVTWMRSDNDNLSKGDSLKQMLDMEVKQGLTENWFYMRFERQTQKVLKWMNTQLQSLSSQGYLITAYAAAAKGMVLLHAMKARPDFTYDIEYVVDDAPLKQDKFCPGTRIPVKPTKHFGDHDPKIPIAVVIFAWNFYNEICENIARHLPRETKAIAVVPFPVQRIVEIDAAGGNGLDTDASKKNRHRPKVLVQNPDNWAVELAGSWPLRSQRRLVRLITYAKTREDTIWLHQSVRHHASMFDDVTVVTSLPFIGSESPPWNSLPTTWNVVRVGNDDRVAGEMKKLLSTEKQNWIMALSPREFVLHRNFRPMVANIEETSPKVNSLTFQVISMAPVNIESLDNGESLLAQHTLYLRNPTTLDKFTRKMTMKRLEGPEEKSVLVAEGFISRYIDAPWNRDETELCDLRSVSNLTPPKDLQSNSHAVWRDIYGGSLLVDLTDKLSCPGLQDSSDHEQLGPALSE